MTAIKVAVDVLLDLYGGSVMVESPASNFNRLSSVSDGQQSEILRLRDPAGQE